MQVEMKLVPQDVTVTLTLSVVELNQIYEATRRGRHSKQQRILLVHLGDTLMDALLGTREAPFVTPTPLVRKRRRRTAEKLAEAEGQLTQPVTARMERIIENTPTVVGHADSMGVFHADPTLILQNGDPA